MGALVTALLTGCGAVGGSGSPLALKNYQPESFNADTHSRVFAAGTAHTCEAARRALLSQGYVMAERQEGQVVARKFFQPSGQHHVQLEFRVVCAALRENGQNKTVAFASGLQEQYGLRRVKDSASVGVGGVASLSLPLEGGHDSMVKVSSETVTDETLYQRFFDLMARYLPSAVPSLPESVGKLAAPVPQQQPGLGGPSAPGLAREAAPVASAASAASAAAPASVPMPEAKPS